MNEHSHCQKLWRVWDFALLQANHIACYYFTVADRRHETPGSEKKDLIAHITTSNMNISIFSALTLAPKFHQDCKMGPEGTCICRGFYSRRGIQSKGLLFFEQTVNIVASNKQANLLQPLPQEVNCNMVVLAYLVPHVTSYRHCSVSRNI